MVGQGFLVPLIKVRILVPEPETKPHPLFGATGVTNGPTPGHMALPAP